MLLSILPSFFFNTSVLAIGIILGYVFATNRSRNYRKGFNKELSANGMIHSLLVQRDKEVYMDSHDTPILTSPSSSQSSTQPSSPSKCQVATTSSSSGPCRGDESALTRIGSDGDSDHLPALPAAVPRHIAVIMDGNRRYGKKMHNDALKGHWAGGQTLVDFAQWCMADGVQMLTVYAFSTENWQRDAVEVDTLMGVFARYTGTLRAEAVAKNIRVNVISTDLARLPIHMQDSVKQLEEATRPCTGFVLNICLSYGGRAEIVSACARAAREARDGLLDPDGIDEQLFASYLHTAPMPDPDLLIRTSGESRLSNFLPWQLAYTELLFIDKLWPEMTRTDLRVALQTYSRRTRRFGV